MSPDDIIKIMREAKELGITSLKVDGLEIGGIQPKKQDEPSQEKIEEIIKQFSILDSIPDEEILYWSTPYGQELEQKRLAREKQLKEEGKL